MAHAGLIAFWSGSMTLFELSHLVPDIAFYEQGYILLPHLTTLGFGVGSGGFITNVLPFFVCAALHITSSALLGLAGIYHSIFGPEYLEETTYKFTFAYQWQDRYRVASILGAHLYVLGLAFLILFLKGVYFGGLYDTWASGGGDIRLVKSSSVSLNPYIIGRYLVRAPFGGEGWIISVNNLEDILGGHYWIGFLCLFSGLWHTIAKPFGIVVRSFAWTAEAYLAYGLSSLALCGYVAGVYAWFNNTAYPSELFGPTGPEASQAQAFTFLIRDQKLLGSKVTSSQGPTGLGKYLMRSPSGEIIFGGETMRFWSMQAPWVESLHKPSGLDINLVRLDIQSWQQRRSADYMTHPPIGSLNSVGGLATEINSVNFVSPRSWLTCAHWVLGYSMLLGHWWHGGRSRAAALSIERGLSRLYEPALYLRPID